MSRRTLAAGAIAGASVLALAGCVAEVPAPVTSAPPLEQSGALLEPQSDRIVEQTMAELAAADEALDTAGLTDRVGGDIVTIRAAEYTLAKADDGPAPAALPEQMQAVYVSAADTWPRTMVTVTEQAGEDSTPVVLLWVQDSVDVDYQLREYAHMVPGATLPAMPSPATGAAQLALDAADVDPTPQAAIDAYIELLRAGPDSDLEATFAPDSYRERLFAARDTLSEAASEADGEYVETIQPDAAGSYAMATADGGALVFAPLAIESSFTVEDATVSIDAADEPLLDGELDDTVKHTYRDFIVIYVPGPNEGEDAIPAVVAAEHNLIKVTD